MRAEFTFVKLKALEEVSLNFWTKWYCVAPSLDSHEIRIELFPWRRLWIKGGAIWIFIFILIYLILIFFSLFFKKKKIKVYALEMLK